MLDTDTKRKIDKARDILVGKVPDPKTQVEQITFALIYKFMDSMDQQSVDLGGQPSFFANGYEQFAWSRLMDLRLSGPQRLDHYVRALEQMSANPYIPQLFRDIFKGAFLPYRDSETLNLFLKEMDGFRYDHSEDLGDAYEYLLSILGTQGKAGQFRTPRHIIDFIVRCVDPDKNETVLDPACGTAGFLISAFKHIEGKYKEHPLSPDEKKRLTENFTGYDIAPDMVRLSRVNMYLHQFPNPTIHEYDTLTTEDRWDDNFDVIFANPPFMTPTGGIRPHNRFAVRANRSEVLFVDYIAEHLNPGGRAGIIVPEGIIFQSANAYKALRKMLVESGYLYAVVSLPAGTFNPYSGVKTSILLLDKNLARASENILFVKVEADGFDLGAQRRPVERDDLPEALRIVKAFQADPLAELPETSLAQLVKKSRLAEGGEFSLSAERYKANGVSRGKWPMVKLGEISAIQRGTSITQKDTKQGTIPVIAGGQQPAYFHNTANRDGNVITVSSSGAYAGFVNYFISPIFASDCSTIKSKDEAKALTYYLYLLLKFNQEKINELRTGMAQPHVYAKDLASIEIPLPPLEVQQEIVAEIEGYQKVIDGARMVVENYKPVIPIDPTWPLVKLSDIAEFQGGLWKSTKEPLIQVNILRNTNFGRNGGLLLTSVANHLVNLQEFSKRTLQKGDIILENSGGGPRQPVGRVVFFDIDEQSSYSFSNFTTRIRKQINNIEPKYLFLILRDFYLSGATEKMQSQTSGIRNLNKTAYKDIQIPLPSIKVQRAIIASLEVEQGLIDKNILLIELFDSKITDRIRRVWEGS